MESFVLTSQNPRSIVLCSIFDKENLQAIQFHVKEASSSDYVYSTKILPMKQLDLSEYQQLPKTIYGCLGTLHYMDDDFVCVVTGCQLIGTIRHSKIYRLTEVHFLSLKTSQYDEMKSDLFGSTEEYQPFYPWHEFAKLLSSGFFYFSNEYDLTRNSQKQHFENQGLKSFRVWDHLDTKFLYNKFLLRRILNIRRHIPDYEKDSFDKSGLIVALIQGFVCLEQLDFSSGICSLGMISRINCQRTGTRFNARGIDDDGHVANSVETEVLVSAGKYEMSFCILRGSVPLFWEQQGFQVGNSKIQISRTLEATMPSFDRHFMELLEDYKKLHVVDLLSQKEGHELTLSSGYKQLLRSSDSKNHVSYTQFDFNALSKNSGFDCVSLLISQIKDVINKFGYYLYDKNENKIEKLQAGVFRVNCLDCLDRTNVVQGFISMELVQAFFKQHQLGYYHHIVDLFKSIWANNGDAISMLYAGTGALKSGYTRTGKRTFAGIMDDMRKSATRFYLNNFQDKSKQLLIDSLLGNLVDSKEVNLYDPINEEVARELELRKAEYSYMRKICLMAVTWNVNGQAVETSENLAKLLEIESDVDILAFSLQEIVELTPQQMMSTDPRTRKLWEQAIQAALQKLQQNMEYTLLTSGQLVGAALIIFVKNSLFTRIRNVFVTSIKAREFYLQTGMNGIAGNKGSVGIRFDLLDSTFLLICSHFAAGQNNVLDRNRDYQSTISNTVFPKGLKFSNHK